MRLGPINPDDPALQVYRSLPPRPPAYLGWLVRLFGHKVIHWNRSVEVTYYIWLGKEYLDKVEYVGDRWGINRLLEEKDTDDVAGEGLNGYLRCPTENGGCGQARPEGSRWAVKIERDDRRLILDCARCGYRISLPLDIDLLTPRFTGPLDESGPSPQEASRG